MPNWCDTSYAFRGSTDAITDFKKRIESSMPAQRWEGNSYYPKQNFGDGWLGNVAMEYGLNWEKTNCRGKITYTEQFAEDVFYLETVTAWEPMNELWDAVIKEAYTDKQSGKPKLSYVYESVEQGCGLYINTDKNGEFFKERYCVYTEDGKLDDYYSEDEKEKMYMDLSSVIGDTVDDSNVASKIEEYNEEHRDYSICFYEFSYE